MARRGRERRGSTSRLVTESLPLRLLCKTRHYFVAHSVGYLRLRRVSGSIPPSFAPRIGAFFFANFYLELGLFILKTSLFHGIFYSSNIYKPRKDIETKIIILYYKLNYISQWVFRYESL